LLFDGRLVNRLRFLGHTARDRRGPVGERGGARRGRVQGGGGDAPKVAQHRHVPAYDRTVVARQERHVAVWDGLADGRPVNLEKRPSSHLTPPAWRAKRVISA